MSNAWNELADVLATRRQLESALTPAEVIGSKDYRKLYESQTEFEARRKESRRYHGETSKALLARLGLASEASVREKIIALKKQKEVLWHTVRPDLYSLPPA